MRLFRIRKKSSEDFERFKDCYVSKPGHVMWRNVDGRGVILNSKTASYVTVEDVALSIWELIDKGISIPEMVKIICDEYQKHEKIVKSDLADILDEMRKEGIIELMELNISPNEANDSE